MGRHRRNGAASGEQQPAAPVAGGTRSHRRAKRASVPVRTGLLGVSAAVAMGAVAVASGLVPGDAFSSGDGRDAGQVQSAGSPTDLATQEGSAPTPERKESAASRGSERPEPSASAPTRTEESTKPSKSPAPEKTVEKTATDEKDEKKDVGKGTGGDKPEAPKPSRTSAPQSPDSGQSAAAQVLTLVNQERAKVGCSPVRADAALAKLAADFSKDMAERGFFDHTDPDGATPWDRADKAGVSNLGGENIARGQANAQSVMDSWMNSPGHRANILNCEYKTLGVGVHFAPGGPWWTQDFGF